MADDLLTEEEQIEAAEIFVKENGVWLVVSVVLGAALVFGYRYYESSREQRALKSAAEFGAMTAAVDKNDRNSARRIAEGIIQTYAGSPYADQAELTLARLFVDEGKIADAAGPLTVVMTGSRIPSSRTSRVCASRAYKSMRANRTMRSKRSRAPIPRRLRRAFTRCAAMPCSRRRI